MRGANVCISALVRDCAPALARNLPWLDTLCAQFKSARVVIFENDSRDGSKEMLASWAGGKSSVKVFSENVGTRTVPANVPSGANPFYSRSRIEKMAKYRNQYLDYASRLQDLDYLLVIDLDLHRLELDGIAHAFGQDIPWDAQFANGRISDPWRPELGDFYWDTYAFWEIGDTSPQTEAKMAAYGEMLKPLIKGMPLFAVQSAFGGMGLYRWEALKGLRYGLESNQDDRVEVVVEHTYLHRRLIAAGHSRLFINPSMTVYYDSGPRSRVAFTLERLFHSLRRQGATGTAKRLVHKLLAQVSRRAHREKTRAAST